MVPPQTCFQGQICLLLVQWDLRGDTDHLPHSVGGSRLKNGEMEIKGRTPSRPPTPTSHQCGPLPPAVPLHCSRKGGLPNNTHLLPSFWTQVVREWEVISPPYQEEFNLADRHNWAQRLSDRSRVPNVLTSMGRRSCCGQQYQVWAPHLCPVCLFFPDTLTTSKIYLSCPHVSAFFLKGKPS